MLRFLTENGRNRSNSRQLSEILFFVKLKHQKERKTTFFMEIPLVGKSLWFMQNNNGVKQRFLDCFLKILDKKRKK
jgi:uncharacterized membrane protein